MKKKHKKLLELEVRHGKGPVLECRLCGAEHRDLFDSIQHMALMHGIGRAAKGQPVQMTLTGKDAETFLEALKKTEFTKKVAARYKRMMAKHERTGRSTRQSKVRP